MPTHSLKTLFLYLLFVGCTSKESQTQLKNDSLMYQNLESPSRVGGHNDLPKDYCTIKINYKSFDYPRDREFTWMMNGHYVTVDSSREFSVKTYEGLDTIFFNHPARKKNEFMLCDLIKGQRYEIYYNSCCSDFYFWKEGRSNSDKRLVEFQMTGNRNDKKRIGGVSNEAAFLTANKAFTLTGDYMRSPMFPNRYHVFVEEFEPWHEDSTIARIINPVTRKEGKAFKHSNQKLIDFQYVFLDNDSLRVSVDSNDFTVKVERVKSTK